MCVGGVVWWGGDVCVCVCVWGGGGGCVCVVCVCVCVCACVCIGMCACVHTCFHHVVRSVPCIAGGGVVVHAFQFHSCPCHNRSEEIDEFTAQQLQDNRGFVDNFARGTAHMFE